MKNLKKILLALVLVALIASSVVTVAIAEASYTGTVAEAEVLLKATVATDKTPEARVKPLQDLYRYLLTVDPEDEGFDSVKEAYNQMTFKVMYSFYEDYAKSTSLEQKSEVLAKVYAHKSSAPVICDSYSEVHLSYGYVCNADGCGRYRDFTADEYLNGITASLTCPGLCSKEQQKLAYATGEGRSYCYADFEKQINSDSLSVSSALIAQIYALADKTDSGSADYYDFLEARADLAAYIDSIVKLQYKAPVSALYSGNISEVEQMLASVSASSTFDELKSALADAYSYLVKTPVIPTTDEYYAFMVKYNALADALVAKLNEAVADAPTVEAKAEVLVGFYEYLSETQISEKVVMEFNSLRASLAGQYADVGEGAESLVLFADKAPAIEYASGFDAFVAKITEAEALEGDALGAAVEELYNIASSGVFDPSVAGYSSAMKRYVSVCVKYAESEFVAKYSAEKNFITKAEILVNFLSYVASTPTCEEVTVSYDRVYADFVDQAKTLREVAASVYVANYVAPAKAKVTSSEFVLLDMLDGLNAKYAEYELKKDVESLEAAMKALSNLYSYIVANGIDTEAVFYNSFAAEYDATRSNVVAAMLATIDEAGESEKVAAIAKISAYLKASPVSLDAVVSFNEAAVYALGEGAADYLVVNNYIEAAEYALVILDTEATVDEVMEAAVKFAAIYNGAFDPTDPAYALYVEASVPVIDRVAEFMAGGYYFDMLNASASEYSNVVKKYLGYLNSVYYQSTVSAMQDMVSAFSSSMNSFTTSLASTAKYTSAYDTFAALVADFNSKSTLADRVDSFIALHVFYTYRLSTTAFVIGESYNTAAIAYERAAADFEEELIAFINSSSIPEVMVANLQTAYGYISRVLFSNVVIEAYNDACEELMALDFIAASETIKGACSAFEYETPEGWSDLTARLKLALEMAGTSGEVNDSFIVAYNILSGYVVDDVPGKEYGNKVIDFGKSGFASVLYSFNEVKEAIVSANIAKLEKAKTFDQKSAALVDLKNFIEAYPFSEKLVVCYSDMCDELAASYSQNLSNVFSKFESLIKTLENHVASCPVDPAVLGVIDKARNNSIKEIVGALRIVAVEGMLNEYDSLSGPTALIYKNMLVNKLNGYVASEPLAQTSEASHVSAAVEFVFQEFIYKFAEEIEGLDEKSRETQIKAIGGYISSLGFPYSFVDTFNSAFGSNYSASYAGAATEKGDAIELIGMFKNIDLGASSLDLLESVKSAVEYINGHKFSSDSEADAIGTKIADLKKRVDAETAEQKIKLDSLAKPSEYAYNVLYSADHENGKHVGTMAGTGSDSGYSRVTVKENGNTYAKYYSATGSSYFYMNMDDATKGLVIEMDIMPIDDGLDLNMYFYSSTANKKVQIRSFYIEDNQINYSLGTSGKDATRFEYYKEENNAPIMLTPGQWTNICVAFDFEAATMEMYVDYVSLGKKAICNASGSVVSFDNDYYNSIRITGYSAGNTVCYDNFRIYQGTAFRMTDKQLSQEEWFNTYVSSALDETSTAMARTAAYYAAKELRASVGDASNEFKALFDAFDASAIIAEANEYYLSGLEALAGKIKLSEITTATSAATTKNITAVENYIEENRRFMDQSSDRFMAIGELIISAKEKNVWVGNLAVAVDHLGRFHRATTSASLTRHYNLFKEYYDLCELDKADMMAIAEADPISVAFMGKVLADSSTSSVLDETSTLADYCQRYISYRMLEQDYYENSYIILDCIGFIELIMDDKSEYESLDAYYAALVAEAGNQYDYVETYLSIIRLIVRADAYDASVDGLASALEVFGMLDEEFNRILKEKQYSIIKERLDRYAVTSSYIEKAGICTYLENYIAENNVDLSGAEGIQYLYALEIYKSEIEIYKEDFEAVLEANTEAFIGLVQKMATYTTYKELKPLYDEAIENYYYSMNIDSERAAQAVQIFEMYQDMINDWEANSALFIGYANDAAGARRQSQKFRALVNCANYVDKVDATIAGVASALTKYATALESYNASIEPVRAELSEIGNIVCAVRSESVPAPVLAIVKKFMDN